MSSISSIIFKPKELFSPMEDNQAQEEAEKMLQSFEIENDTVRSADISALQALIPYAKWLIQLFPEMKENTRQICVIHSPPKMSYNYTTCRHI
jgi:hypothetical protein